MPQAVADYLSSMDSSGDSNTATLWFYLFNSRVIFIIKLNILTSNDV